MEYWFYVSSGHQSTIKSSLARKIPNDKIKNEFYFYYQVNELLQRTFAKTYSIEYKSV